MGVHVPPERNASKKLRDALPEPAARSTCGRYWAGLERISRRVQRAGATDRATDFRAVKGLIDDLANGTRASPALGAAPQTAIHVAGRPTWRRTCGAAHFVVAQYIAGADDHQTPCWGIR